MWLSFNSKEKVAYLVKRKKDFKLATLRLGEVMEELKLAHLRKSILNKSEYEGFIYRVSKKCFYLYHTG